jgi:hypothetical protein
MAADALFSRSGNFCVDTFRVFCVSDALARQKSIETVELGKLSHFSIEKASIDHVSNKEIEHQLYQGSRNSFWEARRESHGPLAYFF